MKKIAIIILCLAALAVAQHSQKSAFYSIEGLKTDGTVVVGSAQWNVTASDSINGASISSRSITDLALPSLAGDVTGTLGANVVGDDSHAHTGTTISGIDISDDTNLTAGDGLTLTDDDLDILLSLRGGLEFGGDSLQTKLNGTTLSKSSLGLKVDNVSDADMGDVTISSGAWAVEDDSHNHTTASAKFVIDDSLRVEETSLLKGDVTANTKLVINDSLRVEETLLVKGVSTFGATGTVTTIGTDGKLTIGASNAGITAVDTVFTAGFVPRWVKFTSGAKVWYSPVYADTTGKW